VEGLMLATHSDIRETHRQGRWTQSAGTRNWGDTVLHSVRTGRVLCRGQFCWCKLETSGPRQLHAGTLDETDRRGSSEVGFRKV
jgi:hypothetical protein